MHELRSQAKARLSEANQDGSLQQQILAVKEKARLESGQQNSRSQENRIDDLRSQARAGPPKAKQDGKLEKLLEDDQKAAKEGDRKAEGNVQKNAQSQEQRISELRSRAHAGLSKATQDGRLQQSLEEGQPQEAAGNVQKD